MVVGQGLPTEPNIMVQGDTGTVIIGTSTGEVAQIEVPVAVGVNVLYWREVM